MFIWTDILQKLVMFYKEKYIKKAGFQKNERNTFGKVK